MDPKTGITAQWGSTYYGECVGCEKLIRLSREDYDHLLQSFERRPVEYDAICRKCGASTHGLKVGDACFNCGTLTTTPYRIAEWIAAREEGERSVWPYLVGLGLIGVAVISSYFDKRAGMGVVALAGVGYFVLLGAEGLYRGKFVTGKWLRTTYTGIPAVLLSLLSLATGLGIALIAALMMFGIIH